MADIVFSKRFDRSLVMSLLQRPAYPDMATYGIDWAFMLNDFGPPHVGQYLYGTDQKMLAYLFDLTGWIAIESQSVVRDGLASDFPAQLLWAEPSTIGFINPGNDFPSPSYVEVFKTNNYSYDTLNTPVLDYIAEPINWISGASFRQFDWTRFVINQDRDGTLVGSEFDVEPGMLYFSFHMFDGTNVQNYNMFHWNLSNGNLNPRGFGSAGYTLEFFDGVSYSINFNDGSWAGFSQPFVDGVVNNDYEMTPANLDRIQFDDADINDAIAAGYFSALQYQDGVDLPAAITGVAYAVLLPSGWALVMIGVGESGPQYDLVTITGEDAASTAMLADMAMNGGFFSFDVPTQGFFASPYLMPTPFQFLFGQLSPLPGATGTGRLSLGMPIQLGCWSPCPNVGYIEE